MPHEKTFGHGLNVIHVGWDSNHGTYAQVGVVPKDGDPLVDGLFATLDEAGLTKLMSVLRRAQRRLRDSTPTRPYVGGYITPSTPVGQLPVVPTGPAPGATPR